MAEGLNPHATWFTIHILAAVAEHEAKQISQRTKDALAKSTKQLGGYKGGPVPDHRLGVAAHLAAADAFAARVAPILTEQRERGLILNRMAANLNARGVLTPRKGAWTATAVRRALARCKLQIDHHRLDGCPSR